MNDPSPAMCLVCGETICALSKCCAESYFNENKIGGATAHALRCTKGNYIVITYMLYII